MTRLARRVAMVAPALLMLLATLGLTLGTSPASASVTAPAAAMAPLHSALHASPVQLAVHSDVVQTASRHAQQVAAPKVRPTTQPANSAPLKGQIKVNSPPGSNHLTCSVGTIDYHVYNPTQNGGGYEQTHWASNGCNQQQRPCIWDATGKAKCGGWVKAVGLKDNTPKAYGVISSADIQVRNNSTSGAICSETYPTPGPFGRC